MVFALVYDEQWHVLLLCTLCDGRESHMPYVWLCTSDKEHAIFGVTLFLDFVRLLLNHSFQFEQEDPRVPPSTPLEEKQEFHTS